MEKLLPYTGKEFLDSLNDGWEVWIYLTSHAGDFKVPELRRYLDRYVRGSGGVSMVERVKLMKRLWDSIGTEFGARHELYKVNYSGSHEEIRRFALLGAVGSGRYERWKSFADSCMAEYDLEGWTVPDLVNPDDVSVLGELGGSGFDPHDNDGAKPALRGMMPTSQQFR